MSICLKHLSDGGETALDPADGYRAPSKPTTVAPPADRRQVVTSDPTVSYVAGAITTAYFRADPALSMSVDEVEAPVGMDAYAKMSRTEPIVAGILLSAKGDDGGRRHLGGSLARQRQSRRCPGLATDSSVRPAPYPLARDVPILGALSGRALDQLLDDHESEEQDPDHDPGPP
ncbi:MAG: hypothetical protein ACHQ50_05340 [Fimbriimonadales bacterium]